MQPWTVVRPFVEVVHRQRERTDYQPIQDSSKYSEETMQLSPFPEWINITAQVCGNIDSNPIEIWGRLTPIDLISAAAGSTIDHYQIAAFYTPSRQNPNRKFAGKIVYGKKF